MDDRRYGTVGAETVESTPTVEVDATNSGKIKKSIDPAIVERMFITEGEPLLGQTKLARRMSVSYKHMLSCLILILFIGGTVGLSIYFKTTKIPVELNIMATVSVTAPTITKKEPDAKEAVLILNTAKNSNDAMVITSTGESHFDFSFRKY